MRLVLGMFLLSTSCNATPCTTIGCGPPLVVQLHAKSGTFANGSYVIALTTDTSAKVAVTCTFGGTTPSCTANDAKFSASATADAIHILVNEKSSKLHLDVTQGTTSLLATDVTPAYADSRPNGDRCEPTCNSAVVDETI